MKCCSLFYGIDIVSSQYSTPLTFSLSHCVCATTTTTTTNKRYVVVENGSNRADLLSYRTRNTFIFTRIHEQQVCTCINTCKASSVCVCVSEIFSFIFFCFISKHVCSIFFNVSTTAKHHLFLDCCFF